MWTVRCNCQIRCRTQPRVVFEPREGCGVIERTSREPTYEWNQRPTLTRTVTDLRLIPTSSTSVTVVEAMPSSRSNRSKNSSRQSGVSSWRITVPRASNGDMVAAGRPNSHSPSSSTTRMTKRSPLDHYQEFKTEVVSQLDCAGSSERWRLTGREIDAALHETSREPVAPSI